MCGIMGYMGVREAAPVLLEGLRCLEYRGYDSAGAACVSERGLCAVKAAGKLAALREKLKVQPLFGRVGIGHTRWATHGAPTEENAHPHLSQNGLFAVVHNGVLENERLLREALLAQGVTFRSETDTEVIAQLLEQMWDGDFLSTVQRVTAGLSGSYALAILCAEKPDQLCAVRKGSPLVLGFGENETFLASDIPALLPFTRSVQRLQDGEIALINPDRTAIIDRNGNPAALSPVHIGWDREAAEKEGYRHFMLKEIFAQPRAAADTAAPFLQCGCLDGVPAAAANALRRAERICITACGTAYHAGLTAKIVFETLLGIPADTVIASEFQNAETVLQAGTPVLVISQSGETADTLSALRAAKRRGCPVFSVVNVPGSTIAAESDAVFCTRAGPEISVASTKAYTAQLVQILLFGLYAAALRGVLSENEAQHYRDALKKLPRQMEDILACREVMQHMASRLFRQAHAYFIGRGTDYASAMEGALKLKEISYIHAEGFAAGELKHGPISLIEPGTPVVALLTDPRYFGKMHTAIREVHARGAQVMAMTLAGENMPENLAEPVFYLPRTVPLLQPALTALPLQLLAYYTAAMRQCPIDQPRNLAKSVTVE